MKIPVFFSYRHLINIISNGSSSHFFNVTEVMKFHLPTQTHRGDSFGVLFGWLDSWMCRAHSSAPLHLASQFAKGHLNESAKLKRPSCSLGAVHLHLDPSGQCLHELIASTIDRGPQCPDDVLFSKWKSHSYVIKKLRLINYRFFQVSSFMMR